MQINILNKYRISLRISRLEKRTGICSDLYKLSNKHILLWDFDDVINLDNLIADLIKIQEFYGLSRIFILKSSLNNYHAYCFVSKSFMQAIAILASTPNIDESYLRIGIVRGYFTLRISDKNDSKFEFVKLLESNISENVNVLDLTVNEYITSNIGGKNG